MRLTASVWLLVGAATAFSVLVLVVAGWLSPLLSLAVLPALIGGAAMVLQPFLGLAFVFLFTQLDAVASRLSQGLPISALELATAAMLAGLVLHSYHQPRRERLGPDELTLRFAALFLLAMPIAFLGATKTALALPAAMRIASLIVLLYLTIRLADDVWKVRLLALCLAAAALVSGAVLIFDTLTGTHLLGTSDAATQAQWGDVARSSGASNQDPTQAAIMQTTGTIAAIVLFLEFARWRWLTGPAALIGTAAVMLSYSRSASLVFGIAAVMLLFHYRKTRLFPLAVMAGCLAGAALIPFVPEEYWERMGTLLDFNSDYTLWRRFGYNLIGLDLLTSHPLFGVGPGNFEHYYVQSEYAFYPGRTPLPRRLHNMYLSIAVEYGLVGFLAFIGIHASALLSIWRARLRAARSEIGGLATTVFYAYLTYLLGSAFTPNEYAKYSWLLPGLAVATARLSRALPAAAPTYSPSHPVATARSGAA
jgi:O-antigen ligase